MFEDIYKFNNIENIYKKKITTENMNISPIPENASVTMAYVPYQEDDQIYSPEQGISCGTMFPVLDKPFNGYRG